MSATKSQKDDRGPTVVARGVVVALEETGCSFVCIEDIGLRLVYLLLIIHLSQVSHPAPQIVLIISSHHEPVDSKTLPV